MTVNTLVLLIHSTLPKLKLKTENDWSNGDFPKQGRLHLVELQYTFIFFQLRYSSSKRGSRLHFVQEKQGQEMLTFFCHTAVPSRNFVFGMLTQVLDSLEFSGGEHDSQ